MKNSFLFHGNDAGSVRAILHPQPHAAPSPPSSPRSPRSTRRDSRANNTRGAGRMMSDGAGRAIGHGSFRHANRPPRAGLMPAATAGKRLRLRPPRPRLPQVASGPPAQTEPELIMRGTTISVQQARIELPTREAAAQGGSSTRCNPRRLPSPLPPFAPAPSGPGRAARRKARSGGMRTSETVVRGHVRRNDGLRLRAGPCSGRGEERSRRRPRPAGPSGSGAG